LAMVSSSPVMMTLSSQIDSFSSEFVRFELLIAEVDSAGGGL
jgi:hypothetical protein